MREFKYHWTQVPRHIDISTYQPVYRNIVKQMDKADMFVLIGVRDGCLPRILIDALGDRPYRILMVDEEKSPYIDEVLCTEGDQIVSLAVVPPHEAVGLISSSRKIDFLHIDYDPHTYEQTSTIFSTFEPKVSRRGCVMFHDCTPGYPGVFDFVKNNIEPQPEWLVEYQLPRPESPHSAPAMAIRI